MNSNNRKKIIYLPGPFDGTYEDGAEFMCKISEKLEIDFDLSYVTAFKTVHQILKSRGKRCCYVIDEIEKYSTNNLQQELKEIEDRYETTLEKIMVGDFDQYHSDRKKAQETLLKFFKFWENHLDKEKPDYVIGGGQRFINMVPYTICKKKNIKFLITQSTPFPNTFCFSENIMGYISALDKYWAANKDKKLTKEEIIKVEEYINTVVGTKKRPFYIDSTPHVGFAKLKFFLEKAYDSFFIEKLKTPYSKPWRGAYNYVLRIIRSKLAQFLYSEVDYDKKYIFFPLHVEWDSPILVWNQNFIDQSFLIKAASYSLPADVTLYVKEHSGDIGGASIVQLMKIAKMPRVKLIKPQEDSHKLIKNSEAVLTIAGTSGWEALLIKKPVICVGNTYYRTSGLTWVVDDFSQFADIIKKAITQEKTDTETLYKFISAYQKIVSPGKMDFTQLYYANESNRDFVLSEENIEKVAEGIKKQIRLCDKNEF